MLNKWTGIGNLGRDPDLRYTPGGAAVCEFSMACTERWTNRDGERQERTEWVRVTAWNRTAEACNEYLAKGSKVYVEGKLQTDEYEKDGIRRWSTKIQASQVLFLDSRSDREGGRSGGGGGGYARSEPRAEAAAPAGVDPNDLPFE